MESACNEFTHRHDYRRDYDLCFPRRFSSWTWWTNGECHPIASDYMRSLDTASGKVTWHASCRQPNCDLYARSRHRMIPNSECTTIGCIVSKLKQLFVVSKKVISLERGGRDHTSSPWPRAQIAERDSHSGALAGSAGDIRTENLETSLYVEISSYKKPKLNVTMVKLKYR